MQNIPDLLGLPFTQLNWIEPGTFLFQGKKEITFKKGFYAGCYQVTQELYQKVTGQNPSYFKGRHRPVESVSWVDVQQFFEQLNKHVKHDDGLQFRFPSETQWEYAAHAKRNFEYSGSTKLHEVGWFEDNSNGQTMPVGLKEPNAFGLYDMSGNVWEWCEDTWRKEVETILMNGDAFVVGDEDLRMIRGGGWNVNNASAHLSIRNRYPYELRSHYDGVRVFRY